MRREWTNEIFRKSAFGYSRPFFVMLVLGCSVIQLWNDSV